MSAWGASGEGALGARGGQCGVGVPEGFGQASGVDCGVGRGICDGPVQGGAAHSVFFVALGDEEAHGCAGDFGVFQGGGVAFGVVALQEFFVGPPVTDVGEFPGRVLGVLDPGVEAAGPEGGHEVGVVAGEQDPAHTHAFGHAGVEAVDRVPDDFVGGVADDAADTAVQASAAFFGCQVEVGGYLPIDAIDRVGAGVDEDLASGVPFGVEVEAAFSFPVAEVGPDVADEEAVVEAVTVKSDAKGGTDGAGMGAQAGDRVGAVQCNGPVGGPAGDGDAGVVLGQVGDGVVPADLDVCLFEEVVEDLFGA